MSNSVKFNVSEHLNQSHLHVDGAILQKNNTFKCFILYDLYSSVFGRVTWQLLRRKTPIPSVTY